VEIVASLKKAGTRAKGRKPNARVLLGGLELP